MCNAKWFTIIPQKCIKKVKVRISNRFHKIHTSKNCQKCKNHEMEKPGYNKCAHKSTTHNVYWKLDMNNNSENKPPNLDHSTVSGLAQWSVCVSMRERGRVRLTHSALKTLPWNEIPLICHHLQRGVEWNVQYLPVCAFACVRVCVCVFQFYLDWQYWWIFSVTSNTGLQSNMRW